MGDNPFPIFTKVFIENMPNMFLIDVLYQIVIVWQMQFEEAPTFSIFLKSFNQSVTKSELSHKSISLEDFKYICALRKINQFIFFNHSKILMPDKNAYRDKICTIKFHTFTFKMNVAC